MGIAHAIALLGGVAGGYVKGLAAHDQRKRQEEDDAFRREEQGQRRMQWQQQNKLFDQQQADRDAERAAMAPTKVDDAPVAPPIGSRDEPRAPEDQGIRAAGQTFTNRADADKAATEYNALSNRMQRAAAAVSDPMRAAQLETTALNAEAGTMARIAARRKESDDTFNRELLGSVTDFSTLERFVNDSKGDGQGGALKIKIQPSADGKTVQVLKVNPDGTTAPTPFSFQNNTEGVQQAVGIIGMRLSPEQKLAHLQGTAKTEEERRRWDWKAGLDLKDSEARRLHEQRMLTVAEHQARAWELRASASAGGGGQAGALTIADLKDGHKTIAATLNADYKTQVDNAADDKTAKAIKTARESEIADVQRIYTGAMSAGFALTPEQAIVAYRNGKPGMGTFQKKDGSGTVRVQGVLYQGRFIPMAENPGAAAPAASPAPTDQGATASAQRAPGLMARVAAGPSAPPAPPESAEAGALDAARAAAAATQKRFLSFGARQRAADPVGFAAAQREHNAAVGALQQAEAQWRKSVQRDAGSAFRYAQP